MCACRKEDTFNQIKKHRERVRIVSLLGLNKGAGLSKPIYKPNWSTDQQTFRSVPNTIVLHHIHILDAAFLRRPPPSLRYLPILISPPTFFPPPAFIQFVNRRRTRSEIGMALLFQWPGPFRARAVTNTACNCLPDSVSRLCCPCPLAICEIGASEILMVMNCYLSKGLNIGYP